MYEKRLISNGSFFRFFVVVIFTTAEFTFFSPIFLSHKFQMIHSNKSSIPLGLIAIIDNFKSIITISQFLTLQILLPFQDISQSDSTHSTEHSMKLKFTRAMKFCRTNLNTISLMREYSKCCILKIS